MLLTLLTPCQRPAFTIYGISIILVLLYFHVLSTPNFSPATLSISIASRFPGYLQFTNLQAAPSGVCPLGVQRRGVYPNLLILVLVR